MAKSGAIVDKETPADDDQSAPAQADTESAAEEEKPAAVDDQQAGKTEAGKVRWEKPRWLLGAIAAGVVLVAVLAGIGFFAWRGAHRQQELDRRADATRAACDFGNSFATYRGDDIDDYLGRLQRSGTGEWRKTVSDIGPDLKKRFQERKVSSTAKEVHCGYESGTGDKARVVLMIDQSFSSAEPNTQPGEVKVAANVDMQHIAGNWLVANFDSPITQR